MPRSLRTRIFQKALERAASIVAGNRKLGRLLTAVASHMQHPGRSLRGLQRDVFAMARLVREAIAGRYRTIPKRSLIAIVAGLLYLADPFDAIPDFIPLIGFADDAAVVAWVLSRFKKDLDDFLAWEQVQGPVIDIEPVAG